LNVTENCNLRCLYCKFSGSYPLSRRHSPAVMSKEVAHKAIRLVVEHSDYLLANTRHPLSIGFYGGEPLLAFAVIQSCVDYARTAFPEFKNRFSFALTTNLVLENDAVLDYLMDNKFYVLVSLDGPHDLHDRYRKSKTGHCTFNQIVDNLHRMKARNPENYAERVGFSVVLAPPYDLKAVADFFRDEDIITKRKMMVSYVDWDDTTFFDRFDDMPSIQTALKCQYDDLIERFKVLVKTEQKGPELEVLSALLGDQLKDIVQRPLVKLADWIFPNGICIPGFQKIFVGTDGRLYLCEKVGCDLPIGDVDHGLDVAAVSSIIQDFVAISEPRCLNCWAMRFCKMCFLHAVRGGCMDPVKKARQCAATQSGIMSAMRIFCEIMDTNPRSLPMLYPPDEGGLNVELAFRFVRDYRQRTELAVC